MRIFIVLCALVLASCNTVQGLGQDLESAGKKGEEVIKGD
jgi:predicted small secreted protein